MVRIRPRPVWRLMRGQKLYGRISDRELLLLAELGHLKSGDLLWRPGLGGWVSPECIPGVLAPSLPRVQSPTAQSETAKISALFFAAWQEAIRWQDKLTLFARDLIRSVKMGGFLRLMQRRGVFVGLLIAAVFGGSIDVAMRTFAIGAETSEKAASPKAQDLQIAAAVPDTAKPVQINSTPPNAPKTIQSLEPKPEIDVTKGEDLSISNIRPTDGFTSKASTSVSQSEAPAKPDSVTNSTSVSQLDSAAQSDQADAVPLPARKPDGPIAKEGPRTKATSKRIAQRRGEREPKPMRFGSIGYNYNAQ
jgi:hypothetical protein